ncbi:hypothetical protein F4810DRAFT_302725 [Camillea tinctor]|nr:hypothetical protein F4810DRAFT_302725 [Camillea tinctor]
MSGFSVVAEQGDGFVILSSLIIRIGCSLFFNSCSSAIPISVIRVLPFLGSYPSWTNIAPNASNHKVPNPLPGLTYRLSHHLLPMYEDSFIPLSIGTCLLTGCIGVDTKSSSYFPYTLPGDGVVKALLFILVKVLEQNQPNLKNPNVSDMPWYLRRALWASNRIYLILFPPRPMRIYCSLYLYLPLPRSPLARTKSHLFISSEKG